MFKGGQAVAWAYVSTLLGTHDAYIGGRVYILYRYWGIMIPYVKVLQVGTRVHGLHGHIILIYIHTYLRI